MNLYNKLIARADQIEAHIIDLMLLIGPQDTNNRMDDWCKKIIDHDVKLFLLYGAALAASKVAHKLEEELKTETLEDNFLDTADDNYLESMIKIIVLLSPPENLSKRIDDWVTKITDPYINALLIYGTVQAMMATAAALERFKNETK
jgi:hypothetical protein